MIKILDDSLRIRKHDRPCTGSGYRVFDVFGSSLTLAHITVYDTGHRTYEFDNEILYDQATLEKIVNQGKALDPK